jgi:ankyrin repeat protein
VKRHEAATLKEYVDDGAFRALVGEILEAKAWAKEKKELWMRDEPQMICFLQGWSLRECHRLWQSYLRQSTAAAAAAAGSSDEASASLQLLVSRSLVKRGVVGEVNADGEDVMVLAGGDGWTAMDIHAAAAAGADVAAVDASGYSGVWNAARYGHKESLAALLEVKGDVAKCDGIGRSAMFMASRNGHAECLKLLLDAGGDVNNCKNDGFSPIYVAAEKGHAECLKLLLAAGGDVNKCNNDGRSPIYQAAQNGHAECLKLLLAAGGDVNKCHNDGFSPIYQAAQNGHAECLKLLLAAGGDVNKCHNDGRSPIYVAAQNGHAECLKLLLAAGGDVNKCDSSGMSPALVSFQNGHLHVFEVSLPEFAQQATFQFSSIDAEFSAVVELHRAAGTVVINRHRGFGKLTVNYLMQFQAFNTFAADVMLLGGCFYFELEVVDVGKYLQFGLCMQGFEQRRCPQGQGVGDDQYSWAVDGDRSLKWHNGPTNYGSTWTVGDVIGFTIDMRSQATAVMSVSVNGSFAAPNGIAFDNIEAPYLTPAFSASSGQYRVNFGDRPFAYAPIEEQYMSVHAFHKQNQQK